MKKLEYLSANSDTFRACVAIAGVVINETSLLPSHVDCAAHLVLDAEMSLSD